MRVLDANFLIDHLDGHPKTASYFEAAGGDTVEWVVPAPAFAEVVVGAGNRPDGGITPVIDSLDWTEVRPVDRQTATVAGEIAQKIDPQGPSLDPVDALVAATGRKLDATVVSADNDLLHPESRRVVSVDGYR